MRKIVFALIVFSFLGSAPVRGGSPVNIPDPGLKAAIEQALWITDPTPADMLGLTSLYAACNKIDSLAGLEYAVNMRTLDLSYNQIRDISVLSSLSNLQTLAFTNNGVSDLSPLAGMAYLSRLDVHDNNIADVSALASLSNLSTVILRGNQIEVISPLAGLTNLQQLVLERNRISDLSPLAGLVNLSHLDLANNQIDDIAALAPLTQLRELILCDNDVRDLSALTGFQSLESLDLRENPLNDEAFDAQIAQIAANNPGIIIQHDRGPYSLTVSCSPGGSVRDPGEGTFVYSEGASVRVAATADPGYIFDGFSGSLDTQENPTMLVMCRSYQIRAGFQSLLDTLYVDDDAPADPGKNDAGVSDPRENGTAEHPFDAIQEAIDVAGPGAVIHVRAGIYRENIHVTGKTVDLRGREPNAPAGNSWPVIHAAGSGPVVSLSGTAASRCLLTGFVITAGTGSAINCSGGTATIAHCLIVGNRPSGFESPLLQCTDSDAAFIHCTMADNHIDACNEAIRAVRGKLALTNSIFYHNRYSGWSTAAQRIFADEDSEIALSYCCVADGWPGAGNIDADPLFVSRGQWTDPDNPYASPDPSDPAAVWVMGDYHLQSSAGRWDARTRKWVADDLTSPCIDAGDPLDPVGDEPAPNGRLVDLGAYGGTAEASKSF